jgi:ABC-2 type transport system permease protein
MRWLQIARKDIGDARRSYRLQLLVGFFGLLGIAMGYAANDTLAELLVLLLAFLGPLVGLVFTQHTIVQKRESGELAVLLGLPFSRRDIVVGSYVGRSSVVLAGIVAVYVTTVTAGVLTGSDADPVALLTGFVLIAALTLVFVGIALALSAASRTSAVTAAGSFGAYLLFAFQLWSLLPEAVLYLANGFEAAEDTPTAAAAFVQLSPFAGVRNVAAGVAPNIAEIFPLAAQSVPDSPPVYMQPWFGGAVILVWLFCPVILGYYQFERTDL